MPHRFWLLAHTVQNLSLNFSLGAVSVCAPDWSLAPSMLSERGSIGGGGGGGGGAGLGCCCCWALERSRGSAVMVKVKEKGVRCTQVKENVA